MHDATDRRTVKASLTRSRRRNLVENDELLNETIDNHLPPQSPGDLGPCDDVVGAEGGEGGTNNQNEIAPSGQSDLDEMFEGTDDDADNDVEISAEQLTADLESEDGDTSDADTASEEGDETESGQGRAWR